MCDNNTTQLHLPGLTFGDNELDNLLIVVHDVSEDEYHSNWINSWSAGGENRASLVLTLPFTPQASTDTYVVLSVRSFTVNDISTAAAEKIADIARRRTQANVESSSDGDTLSLGSLYGLIQQAQESNTVDSPGNLTVYQTDGTTSLGTKALDTDAGADPIVGLS